MVPLSGGPTDADEPMNNQLTLVTSVLQGSAAAPAEEPVLR